MRNQFFVALISLVCRCRRQAPEIVDECHPPVISEVLEPVNRRATNPYEVPCQT